MWGSRFDRPPDERLVRLNNSFPVDRRLYAQDIRGSQAYARALARAGLLTTEEAEQIQRGLELVRVEFDRGEFQPAPADEDIHTAVERRLFELIGPPAYKLHTGRSRNDQVATDTRLYVMEACERADAGLVEVQRALVAQAEARLDILMPGYTHLRRAQPILYSHYQLSFFWMAQRDRARLQQTRLRAASLPLGSGALTGTPFSLDREFLARELGFQSVSENSLDAVADRDYIAEFLFDASLLAVHLSRLAEDLILYSSPEFGFVEIDEPYTTGSSLMPQKKNPDALELVRAKCGRLVGDLTGLLVTLKALPSTYDKDLQEDKEPLFDAVDTLELVLPVVAGVIGTLRVNASKMRAALDEGMLATDLADALVERGMPFRDAHRVVGELVKLAEQRGCRLSELSQADYEARAPGLDPAALFDFERSVSRRESKGGTGPAAVREQIEAARKLLES